MLIIFSHLNVKMMKSNEISWNHEGDQLRNRLGLTEEHATNVEDRVTKLANEKMKDSNVAQTLIEEYGDDTPKLVYALMILEPIEEGIQMAAMFVDEDEEVSSDN